MDPNLTPSRPKLDRLNAAKNFDYNPSTSSFSLDVSPRRATSLPLDSKSSFRINGFDGEFELICRTLGFSGPDDFSIPTAVWESEKARRSSFDSPSTSTSTLRLQSQAKANVDANYIARDSKLSKKLDSSRFHIEARLIENELNRNGVRDKREGEVNNLGSTLNLTKLDTGVGTERNGVSVRTFRVPNSGGGIKGDRPPVLAPPTAMLQQPPAADNLSSSWDLLKSFAPVEVEVSELSNRGDPVIEENKEGEDSDGDEETEQFDRNRLGENEILSEACTSNDDDSDGDNDGHAVMEATTQVVHCISPSATFRRNIISWQKGEHLGSGSFGTVFEGFTDDGFFFAVKEVSLLDQGSQGKQSILQLEQEISLLREFEHDNIVRYLGTDKDEAKLYIFLELATKGSLAKLYNKYHLRDSQVSAYTRQILNGLRYLHDRGVVHRDIKCANILVDANGSVKLADFGLAKATSNDIKSCKGTAFWMAPEVVNLRNRTYGLAADIWSLGCTVLEMLTGRPPYSHLEGMQAIFKIGKGEPPLVPDSLSKDAKDFILTCLKVNPNDRPTAVQLLGHPFVKRPIQPFPIPPSPRFMNSPEKR